MSEKTIYTTEINVKGAEAIKKLEKALSSLKKKDVTKGMMDISASLQYLSEVTRTMPKTIKVNSPDIKGYQKIIKFVEKWRIELQELASRYSDIVKKEKELKQEKKEEQKIHKEEQKHVPVSERKPFAFSKKDELDIIEKQKKTTEESRNLLGVYDAIDKNIKQGWLESIRNVDELSDRYYRKLISQQRETQAKQKAAHQIELEQTFEKIEKEYELNKTRKDLTNKQIKFQVEAEKRIAKIREQLTGIREGKYVTQKTKSVEQHISALGFAVPSQEKEQTLRQKQREIEFDREIKELKIEHNEQVKIQRENSKANLEVIQQLANEEYPSVFAISKYIKEVSGKIYEHNKKINELSKEKTEESKNQIKLELLAKQRAEGDLQIAKEALKYRRRIDEEQKKVDKETELRSKIISRVKFKLYKDEQKFLDETAQELERKNSINKDIYNSLGNNEDKMKYLLSITKNVATEGVDEIHKSLKNVSHEIENRSNKGMNRFKQQIKDVVRQFFSMERLIQRISFVITAKLSYDIFDKFNRGVRQTIRNTVEFEDSFAKILGIVTETERATIKLMSGDVINLMSQYGETSANTTRALYDILSAQIDVTDATYVLEEAMKGAIAGFTDVKTAADLLTTTLNAFNLEAKRAGDVNDLLFTIVRLGKTTMEELAPVFGRVAATAGMMKIPIEEIGAALATMTRQGVRTNIAVTSLNQLLLNIAKPTEQTLEIMRKYNVELSIAAIRKEGLAGIMSKLQNLTEEEMVTLASSRRGFMALAAIVNNTEDYYENYMGMINRTGAAQSAFEEQSNTLAFQLKQLGQEVYALTLMFSELVFDIGKPLISFLTNGIKTIRTYEKTVRTFVKALLYWITVKKALSIATKKLTMDNLKLFYTTIGVTILRVKEFIVALKSLTTVKIALGLAGKSLLVIFGKLLPIMLAIGGALWVFGVFSKENKWERALASYTAEMNNLTSAIEKQQQAIKLEELYQGMIGEYEELITNTERTSEETQRLDGIIEQLSSKTNKAADEFRNMKTAGYLAKQMITESKDEVEKLNKELEKNIQLQKQLELERIAIEIRKHQDEVEYYRGRLAYYKELSISGKTDEILNFFLERVSKLYVDWHNEQNKEEKKQIEYRIKNAEEEANILLNVIKDSVGERSKNYELIVNIQQKMQSRQRMLLDKEIDDFKGYTKDYTFELDKNKAVYEEMIKRYEVNKATINEVSYASDRYIKSLRDKVNAEKKAGISAEYYHTKLELISAEIEKQNTLFQLESELLEKSKSQFDALSEMDLLDIDERTQGKINSVISNFRGMFGRLSDETKKAFEDIIDNGDKGIFDMFVSGKSIDITQENMQIIQRMFSKAFYELGKLRDQDHESQLRRLKELREAEISFTDLYILERNRRLKAEKDSELIKTTVGLIDLDKSEKDIKGLSYKALQDALKDPNITQEAQFVLNAEINRRDEPWNRFKDDLEWLNKSMDDVINSSKEWSVVLNNLVFGDDVLSRTRTMTNLLKEQLVEGVEEGFINWKQFGESQKDVISLIRKSTVEELSEMFSEIEGMEQAFSDYKQMIDDANLEQRKQNIQATIDAFQNMFSTLQSLSNAYHQRRLQQINEEKDAAIRAAEGRANREFRSELWLEKEKEKIEAEAEKRQREQHKKQQRWAHAQNAINTAIAITKALSSVSFPLSLAIASMYATMGYLQSRIISMQEFAEGGMPQPIGKISGPGTSTSDSIPIRVSDGEFISRADSVKGNEDIYYKLNEDLAKGKSFGEVAAEILSKSNKITSFTPKYARTNFATGGQARTTRNTTTSNIQYDFNRLERKLNEVVNAIKTEPISINIKTKGIKDEDIARKSIRGQAKIKAHGIS